MTLERTDFDKAGRVTRTIDALGNVTTTGYALTNAGQTTTTTYPDGGTRLEVTAADGKTKEIAGTATARVKYEFGTWPVGNWSKQIKVGDNLEETEWTKTNASSPAAIHDLKEAPDQARCL